MSEHTPGPWRIGDAGNTIFGPPTDRPAPDRIADMSGTKNRRANARLIAAVPAMLEALKYFVDRCGELPGSDSIEDESLCNFIAACDESLHEAHAAITKATGDA